MQGIIRLSVAPFLTLAALVAAGAARAEAGPLYYAAPEPATQQSLGEAAKAAPKSDATQERICFNPVETRERITAHKLTEPFQALQTGNLQGDALRAKLCRWKKDEFVYEISVLRHDGRIVHVYMNAQNGRTVDH